MYENRIIPNYPNEAARNLTRHPDGVRPCDIAAYILTRGGITSDIGDGRRVNANSLQDCFTEFLRCDGTDPRDVAYVDMIRSGFSTFAAQSAFSQSANAAIVRGFDTTRSTSSWVRDNTIVDNFATNSRTQIEGAALTLVPSGGTADHTAIGALREETFRIRRYGVQWVIDEQDVLADGTNLLSTVPEDHGRATRRLREDLIYTTIVENPNLADGVALFDSSRGNDVSAALDATSLQAGITWMRTRKSNGRLLNYAPTHLIVAPTIELSARALLMARYLPNCDNLTLEVEPRLEEPYTHPITGGTVTGVAGSWLLADSTAATLEFARTQEKPRIQGYVIESGQWGIGFQVNFDCGVKALDWRGLYKSTP